MCKIIVFISFPKAITKDMFEEALRALADDDFLTVTGKTVRLLWSSRVLYLCAYVCGIEANELPLLLSVEIDS